MQKNSQNQNLNNQSKSKQLQRLLWEVVDHIINMDKSIIPLLLVYLFFTLSLRCAKVVFFQKIETFLMFHFNLSGNIFFNIFWVVPFGVPVYFFHFQTWKHTPFCNATLEHVLCAEQNFFLCCSFKRVDVCGFTSSRTCSCLCLAKQLLCIVTTSSLCTPPTKTASQQYYP